MDCPVWKLWEVASYLDILFYAGLFDSDLVFQLSLEVSGCRLKFIVFVPDLWLVRSRWGLIAWHIAIQRTSVSHDPTTTTTRIRLSFLIGRFQVTRVLIHPPVDILTEMVLINVLQPPIQLLAQVFVCCSLREGTHDILWQILCDQMLLQSKEIIVDPLNSLCVTVFVSALNVVISCGRSTCDQRSFLVFYVGSCHVRQGRDRGDDFVVGDWSLLGSDLEGRVQRLLHYGLRVVVHLVGNVVLRGDLVSYLCCYHLGRGLDWLWNWGHHLICGRYLRVSCEQLLRLLNLRIALILIHNLLRLHCAESTCGNRSSHR